MQTESRALDARCNKALHRDRVVAPIRAFKDHAQNQWEIGMRDCHLVEVRPKVFGCGTAKIGSPGQ